MMKNTPLPQPLSALILALMIFLTPLSILAQETTETEKEPVTPSVSASALRGSLKEARDLEITFSDLPKNLTGLVIQVKPSSENLSLGEGGLTPEWQLVSRLNVEESNLLAGLYTIDVTGDVSSLKVPVLRVPVTLSSAPQKLNLGIEASYKTVGKSTITIPEINVMARSFVVTDPATLFAVLAAVVAIIYMLSTVKSLETFFKYFPPLIWMYFIPMILTTIGITPDQSALYSPFMSKIMLPAILVLLIIPSDIRTVVKLGPKAIAVMLVATLGIALGAIGSFGIFHAFMGDSLPDGTWQGLAALSGSWIGGSPNMTAVIESVGAPANIIGPLIIVDTVLAYSWLGVLVALSGYQHRIDKMNNASTQMVEELSERVRLEQEANNRMPKPVDIAVMIGLAFAVSQICLAIGPQVFNLLEKLLGEGNLIGEVVSGYGWAILLITVVGLFLSTTKVRHLDYCGASSIGYIGLYLLLTTYGARADLRSIFEVPVFFAMGLLWLMIHIIVLTIGLKLLKAPLFLGATSSMANIGGTASAPVVAASYYNTMAPVGLLMGIIGGTIGTPIAFAIATILKMIAGE